MRTHLPDAARGKLSIEQLQQVLIWNMIGSFMLLVRTVDHHGLPSVRAHEPGKGSSQRNRYRAQRDSENFSDLSIAQPFGTEAETVLICRVEGVNDGERDCCSRKAM